MMTWNNDWVSSGESIWSIFNKINAANVIDEQALIKFFNKNTSIFSREKETIPAISYSFNNEKFYEITNFDIIDHLNKQLLNINIINTDINKFIDNIQSKELRICSLCHKDMFHSTYHQLYLFKYCPYHSNVKLFRYLDESGENKLLDNIFYPIFLDDSKYVSYTIFKHWVQTTKEKKKQFLNELQNYHFLYIDQLEETFSIDFQMPTHSYLISMDIKSRASERWDLDIYVIYKKFLRYVRRKCKKKCYKKHFKRGDLGYYCIHCLLYLKMRKRFELIKSEWDLYFIQPHSKRKLKNTELIFLEEFERWGINHNWSLYCINKVKSYMFFHYLQYTLSFLEKGASNRNNHSLRKINLMYSFVFKEDKMVILNIYN